jgi:hypothetical protein
MMVWCVRIAALGSPLVPLVVNIAAGVVLASSSVGIRRQGADPWTVSAVRGYSDCNSGSVLPPFALRAEGRERLLGSSFAGDKLINTSFGDEADLARRRGRRAHFSNQREGTLCRQNDTWIRELHEMLELVARSRRATSHVDTSCTDDCEIDGGMKDLVRASVSKDPIDRPR